jgi:hypothetical protein
VEEKRREEQRRAANVAQMEKVFMKAASKDSIHVAKKLKRGIDGNLTSNCESFFVFKYPLFCPR